MTERDETDFILNYMTEVEAAAEEILASKQHLVELDKRRQKTREAIRVLQKDKVSTKQWVCLGNMFIKMPSKETKKLLEKGLSPVNPEVVYGTKGNREKMQRTGPGFEPGPPEYPVRCSTN
ncbi:p53 and DNA damage-regulated protein 1-like isoform X2 [Ostrea edulis]|uniref:p53 and DNA damage-regulated protein 1-like isoform X2 n=1 Tax=Ostrea edulis TaxID=37623 RepID=UPI0024AEA8EB|nr:p53 and DNA damage-regulated protein 1-like isoform X2 [Ostrea edulis]